MPETAVSTRLVSARVAVTRPKHQCEVLLRMLEARNAYARCLPVVDIAPPLDADAARAALRRGSAFDLAIFTSANAVNMSLELVSRSDLRLGGAAVAAVGPATARALELAGIPVSILPASEFSSEGLLQHSALGAGEIAGKRVLLVKGAGGRPLLTDRLAERGASVSSIDVYRRTRPASKICDLLGEPLEGFSFIVITSGTALENLLELATENEKRHALSAQLVAASRRIAQLARDRGASRSPIVSDSPADEAIVAALENWWAVQAELPEAAENRQS